MSKIYTTVKDLYPVHLHHFKYMQDRAKKLGTDFSRDKSGFLLFVEHIGPVPAGMVRPEIGRRDHSKGYVFGNVEWQSKADNNREMVARVHQGARRSFEACVNISRSLKGRPKTPEHSAKVWESRKRNALNHP